MQTCAANQQAGVQPNTIPTIKRLLPLSKSILLLISVSTLTAQVIPNRDVPLKNWPAPLFWQPTGAEATAGKENTDIRKLSPEANTSPESLVFVAMTPCRVVDTRASQNFPSPFGPPSMVNGATRSFPFQSSTTCSIPATAAAYSLNVTVVPPSLGSPVGAVIMWPEGQTQPNAVTLDDITGDIRNNAAIVPAGTPNGGLSVFVNANTDLVIDINGYYAPQTAITLAQGTASAPSLSFSGDSGTGIFSSGAQTLNLATGGTNWLTVRSDGDIDIPGSIRKNGNLFLHNLGDSNVGLGIGALANHLGLGGQNVAVGQGALAASSNGVTNDTVVGQNAMGGATGGAYNVAIGNNALSSDQPGGDENVGVGHNSLIVNTTGIRNVGIGKDTLFSNTTGNQNTAAGFQALIENNGGFNSALGDSALWHNTSGSNNTAVGQNSLSGNATGNNNIAAGFNAGLNIVLSNNIDIGHAGASADSGVIRIGTSGTQSSFFAAGINNAAVSGAAVLVDGVTGQLGVASSSRRYKEDIHDMADSSSGLFKLRPVTFRYKQPYADGSKPLDYGLIAEEVAEVYPDLVVKNKDGQVETVQYHKLIPMLLNELQKEHEGMEQAYDMIRELQVQLKELRESIQR